MGKAGTKQVTIVNSGLCTIFANVLNHERTNTRIVTRYDRGGIRAQSGWERGWNFGWKSEVVDSSYAARICWRISGNLQWGLTMEASTLQLQMAGTVNWLGSPRKWETGVGEKKNTQNCDERRWNNET